MTRQRALSPLALLLASLLCYGFVLVWTQNVALETTTALEEISTPFSPEGVKILTGGNFSVSVAPWESTTETPVVSTQSSLPIQGRVNESVATVVSKESVTIPPPSTMESTMASMGGARLATEDELISAMDSTRVPLNTTTNNILNALTKSTTELGMASQGGTAMVEDKNGNLAVSENNNEVSSGTTEAGDTTDTPATSTGAGSSRDLDALPRAMKKTSYTGGKMTWRVKLQSTLTREEAITAFFEKSCDEIIKNLHIKGISITVGPKRSAMKCV